MESTRQRRVYASAKETFFGLPRHIFTRYWFGLAHIFAIYGVYLLLFTNRVGWKAVAFFLFHGHFVGLGLTVAGHRYWAHKSFKATEPLRWLLLYMHTAAGQLPVFEYVRVHRPHHKHADTDGDPHNAQAGFWHSQIFWTMKEELPATKAARDALNYSDVDGDPLVRFQSKYYWPLVGVTMFLVPMSVYSWLWAGPGGASLLELLGVNFAQYLHTTHCAFMANSATHLWGSKPFDGRIFPRENFLTAFITFGEGWHNYHHAFPWDYKISEFGFGPFNLSTGFIELCAFLGLAYDLRTASPQMVEYKVGHYGDGSHDTFEVKGQETKGSGKLPSWGLEDEDTPPEDFKMLRVLHPDRAG